MELNLTNEQLKILHEELNVVIECMYDSSEDLDEDDCRLRLRELLLTNREICRVIGVEESTTLIYLCCIEDCLNKKEE